MKAQRLHWIGLIFAAMLLPSSAPASREAVAPPVLERIHSESSEPSPPAFEINRRNHSPPDVCLEAVVPKTPSPLVRQFDCFDPRDISAVVNDENLPHVLIGDGSRHRASLSDDTGDSFLFRIFLCFAAFLDAVYYELTGAPGGYVREMLAMESIFPIIYWILFATLVSSLVRAMRSLRR